jgi:hypothetical protein
MSPQVFLSIVGLMYIFTSLSYFKVRRIGMMIAFIGYTIGQIGLIIDALEVGDSQ